MSDYKQCSDGAHKGPGQNATNFPLGDSVAPKRSSNAQPNQSRGKQGDGG